MALFAFSSPLPLSRASTPFAILHGCDWPTIGVAILLYAGFAVLTWHWHDLPVWLAAPLGAVVLAWHGSLQHETIHGHPTRSRTLNTMLGAMPLALWLPYALYRDEHLRHHGNGGRDLTDPDQDPESKYLRPDVLAAAGQYGQLVLRWHATLAGRLLLGPAVLVGRCWAAQTRCFQTDPACRKIWLWHSLVVALILAWVVDFCHIQLTIYLGLVVYPSISLTLLRSFAEHRAASDPRHRTVVVEAGPFWRALFLNNNLHIAHHRHPELPWYRLPAAWRAIRPEVESFPSLVVRGGYREIVARHLMRPAAPVEHPGFRSST